MFCDIFVVTKSKSVIFNRYSGAMSTDIPYSHNNNITIITAIIMFNNNQNNNK